MSADTTDKIKLLQIGLDDLSEQIEEYIIEIDALKDSVYIQVEEEFDTAKDNGNTEVTKKLSNEKKRGIEVKTRLNANLDYTTMIDDLKALEKQKKEIERELHFENRMFIREFCQVRIPI